MLTLLVLAPLFLSIFMLPGERPHHGILLIGNVYVMYKKIWKLQFGDLHKQLWLVQRCSDIAGRTFFTPTFCSFVLTFHLRYFSPG